MAQSFVANRVMESQAHTPSLESVSVIRSHNVSVLRNELRGCMMRAELVRGMLEAETPSSRMFKSCWDTPRTR
jgi:hypothetical protein